MERVPVMAAVPRKDAEITLDGTAKREAVNTGLLNRSGNRVGVCRILTFEGIACQNMGNRLIGKVQPQVGIQPCVGFSLTGATDILLERACTRNGQRMARPVGGQGAVKGCCKVVSGGWCWSRFVWFRN